MSLADNGYFMIKPMRYIGIWWCYHMKTNTWHEGPQHGATTENTVRYMDFAAENDFGGVLWKVGILTGRHGILIMYIRIRISTLRESVITGAARSRTYRSS